ncbi:MAG: tyrosine-type recombinase/integrase [Oscillospiraceae bacterium]|nr:tyrosine-type recombinase/integrase [Oscillospiraceae bacterium]
MTFRRYVDEIWMPQQKARCTESSCKMTENKLKNHISPAIGDAALADITATELNALVLTWSHFAFGTSKTVFSTLKTVMHSAFLDGLIPEDIITRVKPPRRAKNDVVKHEAALTADEVRRLFELLDNEPLLWQCYIRTALDTGMRQGELSALRWPDISPNGVVSVRGTLVNGTVTPTKTGKERQAYLSIETVQLLKRLHAETSTIFVFAGESGGPVGASVIGRYFKTLSAKFGKHLHIHLFRKTFSVLAQENGAAIADTAKALGHSTPATTMAFYSAAADTAAKADADAAHMSIYGVDDYKEKKQRHLTKWRCFFALLPPTAGKISVIFSLRFFEYRW